LPLLHPHTRYTFFFYCSSPPRHLHSFPTRRSSDLTHRRRATSTPVLHIWMASTISAITLSPCRLCFCVLAAIRSERPKQSLHGRSEEHTSELQSRSDLVCRLMLEKKNNKEMKQKCD